MSKTWKDVPGYEGLYKVSESGEILGLKRNKLLKPYIDMSGYLVYALSKKCKAKHIKAHRIVAIAFVDNPMKKPQVNHIDGNKLNNHISNLEWVTASENIRHAFDNGLIKMSEERKRNQGKWFRKKVICFNHSTGENIIFGSENDACRHFGFCKGTISRYIRGLRKSPDNLLFSYLEEETING
ncbi:NUMOD4 domain-containing protein [Domibacillus aminovorans]|uniref:HNH nuclease domain-containing protein n=1 Tax=Domibacillus aminovorans TaxID=29332 RepID=A0A177L416_9BACI|nr:NUMOD4 domain-containing protein [Domibacillus aminovorans]OAH60102.1 hypothetical protein AWH49_18020 [Domibacillus aminovorans]